jgi:hypothetical protein
MRKNKKLIKPTTTILFQYIFFVWIASKRIAQKVTFLKILKKITNKQQLYNAPLLKAAFPAYQNFFIYGFL